MTEDDEAVVRYRLERARAALSGAEMFLELGDLLQCTNRFDYALFYAAIAWCHATSRTASKHTHVRSIVNRELVKTARVPLELAQTYNALFIRRSEADYMDFASVTDEEAM